MSFLVSVLDVDLNLTTIKPACAWNLTDFETISKNGLKVMSTFACGGGSSMGYKLAGCDVIAANDIDPEMAYHYKLNLNPKHYFLCPIRDLITADLPDELFHLDILDGSPPCSTFSMAGNRESDWGKEKHFREGQTKQVLSDLFFDWLDLVERLKPRVAIAENVKGMILGNAKGYTKLIMQRLREIGYRPQLFLVNAADCGVPQRRERVFFCALRLDIDKPELVFKPKEKWVSAGLACQDIQNLTENEIQATAPTLTHLRHWGKTKPGNNYAQAHKQRCGKEGAFNYFRLNAFKPSNTLAGVAQLPAHWNECRQLTFREWKRLGSFPDDYKAKTESIGKYMIGMSVPPKMTAALAKAVIKQWLTSD